MLKWDSLVFVLERGRMEKQDSEGPGPKKMLYLDAKGFVWPCYQCRQTQPVRNKGAIQSIHLTRCCRGAREFHRHRAQNHPERGRRLRRGNSCSVAINQQFVLLKEIILDGVKRFK